MKKLGKVLFSAILLGAIAALITSCGSKVEANHGYDMSCSMVAVDGYIGNVYRCANSEVICYDSRNRNTYSCVKK